MSEAPERKNGHGGRRPGAGRPRGSRDVLPHGGVLAVKSLRWRVPASAPEEIAAVADEAFGVIVATMRGSADTSQMTAARIVREEVCGPQKQQVEHSGTLTLEQLVLSSMPAGEGGK